MHLQKSTIASRVLVADDDPVIRHWLTSILKSDGYEVVSLSDGREAYRILQSDADFKGAVFDLSMPYLDGPDLIRHMRTEKRLKRIPVLMITAERDIQKLALGLAAGPTFSLPKPFTQVRLQKVLGMMLGKQAVPETNSLPVDSRVSPTDAALQRESLENAGEIKAEKVSPDQPVDLQVLRSLANDDDGEDSGLITELIDLYLESAGRQVDAIKAAALEQNASSMGREAHALKGSSLCIGACGVARLCEELEGRADKNSAERIDELVKKLEGVFASTRSVLVVERRKRLQPAGV